MLYIDNNIRHNLCNTKILFTQGSGNGKMRKKYKQNDKIKSLEENGALNRTPQAVDDELFREDEFFDPHDLMQVKYEMVRRVEKDNWNVARASKAFGYSRPFFYEIQKALNEEGLPGLIPRKRGPKASHKLTEDVIQFVEDQIRENNITRASALAGLIRKHFGFKIHPRSIERALEKRKKKRKEE